jgi:hypothetical protein
VRVRSIVSAHGEAAGRRIGGVGASYRKTVAMDIGRWT